MSGAEEFLTRGRVMRLIWIDAAICEGKLVRDDICRAFGVSVPTASADLARFQAMFPWRMGYCRSRKGYFADPESGPATPQWWRVSVRQAADAAVNFERAFAGKAALTLNGAA